MGRGLHGNGYYVISFPDLVDVVGRSLCEFDVNIVKLEDYDNNIM